MGIVVVGSVALDSVKTPFGQREEVLGGAATYFGVAASYFADVSMVAVVGDDFPAEHVEFLKRKGIDTSGLQHERGSTFRWKGEYSADLNTRTTLDTQLNVFANFSPKLLSSHCAQEYVFLGNIDPDLQRSVLEQVESPKLVACDTMNYWIEGKRSSLLKTLLKIDLLIINDEEVVNDPILMLHSNSGITFDLQAIRESLPQLVLKSLKATGIPMKELKTQDIEFWVLVDGQIKYERKIVTIDRDIEPIPFNVEFSPEDRFLTLIVTDGLRETDKGKDKYPYASDFFYLIKPELCLTDSSD